MVQFIIRVKCFISSYFYFCFYHYKIIILNIVVKRNKQLHVVHVSAIEVYRVWLLLLGNLRSNDAMATRTSLKKSIFSLLVLTRALTLSNVGEPNLRTISQIRRREPPFIGFERFIMLVDNLYCRYICICSDTSWILWQETNAINLEAVEFSY